jgi:hypothetical protein
VRGVDYVGYAYGRFEIVNPDGTVYVTHGEPWDEAKLERDNYISTMSLMVAWIFEPFDERLERFQDWDLWKRLLRRRITGTYVDAVLFRTPRRPGITFGPDLEPRPILPRGDDAGA